MKYAFIIELYEPFRGGQPIRFQEFAEGLVQQGHCVDVYTIDYVGNMKSKEVIRGVNVFRVIHTEKYLQKNFFHGTRNLGKLLRYCYKTFLMLRKKSYDLYFYNAVEIFPALLSRFVKKNNAVTCLDFVEYRSSTFWSIMQFLLCRTTDVILCISDSVKEKVSKISSKHKRIQTIPSLVDTQLFKKQGNKHFIFIGRMYPHKDPERAIKVVLEWNRIKKKSIPIVLIGDGILYQKLVAKYKENPLVDLRGEVTLQEKVALLSEAIINVFLSKREGLPKTTIEAMVSGVPTLTTDYIDNGTKDFVKAHEIGIVSEPEMDSLVASLDELYTNVEKYAQKCSAVAADFDISRGVNYFVNILKNN